MVERVSVVVVGAGQAGLSMSHALRGRGIDHVVLERDTTFASWRNRWDGFLANTPNWMNRLPMLDRRVLPGSAAGDFATKAELVDYFDQCVAAVDPPLRTGHAVTKVARHGDGWRVTAGPHVIDAWHVVIANGAMSTPRLPAVAAQVPPGVAQLHSSEYQNPEQVRTGRVLVVGSAASGVQIARLLADSGRFGEISLATSGVLELPRRVVGIPVHRVIHAVGLFDTRRDSPLGRVMFSNLEGRGDPIMHPLTPRQLAHDFGVRTVGRLTGAGPGLLRFSDGATLPTEDLTIIWCTGFRGDYSFIEPGPDDQVFNARGYPAHWRGLLPGARGLSFLGLRYQYTSASHDIYGVGADAEFLAEHIAAHLDQERPVTLTPVPTCCVCDSTDAVVVAHGPDYEYRTSPDHYRMVQCQDCGNVYLNPRPDVSEFQRIYSGEYHSLEFTQENFSLVHRVRSRLEASRLLRYCEGAPADARILDVGCGDGFHLKLLRRYGGPGWTLEGIDLDARAVEAAAADGITIHQGTIEDLDLPAGRYDVVYTIQTIEHVAHPDRVLAAIHRVLKPGGRLVIVTDNTDSVDFTWFRKSYWGGYHFPRHWNLFNPRALARLAVRTGFEVEQLGTIVSPVNWVYSVHNALVDRNAPQWLVDQFSLKSPISLGVFTIVDLALQKTGRGALINAYLRKPASSVKQSQPRSASAGAATR